MLDFHTQLGGDHPYQSPPWSWPLLKRPVAYWFSEEAGAYRHILAFGSPVAWWPAIAALGGLAITWWRSGWGLPPSARAGDPCRCAGDLRALARPVGGPQPDIHLVPAPDDPVPVPRPRMLRRLGVAGTRPARWRSGASVAVVLAFAFWLPVATALPLDPDAWRSRMLFTDCGEQTLPDDTTSTGSPPDGWCWI